MKKKIQFLTCEPSADYQLPLVTSCPGLCTYCYLFTNLGQTPYLRGYANLEDILDEALKILTARAQEITTFEGSATSDPVSIEPITGSLKETVLFFAGSERGRFRFTTKFTDVDGLLNIDHNGHTEIRFSVNTPAIIKKYEFKTPPLSRRLEAARKVGEAHYPLGFLIAPVFYYETFTKDYRGLLQEIARAVNDRPVTLEIITHRFTDRAKSNIEALFPRHNLPLTRENRRYQYGQFGYGKYVYDKELMPRLKEFFYEEVKKNLPQAKILYFV